MVRPVLLFFLVVLLPKATLAADATAGAKAFDRCKVCHTLETGGRATLGPNLHGFLGRKAGAAEGFKFSEAMKGSGIVWNDETVAAFLRDPKGKVPGNRMAMPGITDDDEIANLLAYLKEATR